MMQMLVCSVALFAKVLLLIKLVGRECFKVAEEQVVSTPFRAIDGLAMSLINLCRGREVASLGACPQ